MIVDTSCAPVDILYPTDLSLLNEASEKSEGIIDVLHEPLRGEEKKVRTYRERARRDYLRAAKKRRVGATELRKAIGEQLRYVRRDLQYIETLAERNCLKLLSFMEILLTFRDGRYKLIEVNPRVWGWHTLVIGAGIDLTHILYQDLIGEKIETHHPLNYLKGVRLITDVPTVFEEIIRGRMKISDYLASMKGKKVFAILSFYDPLPFFYRSFYASLFVGEKRFLNGFEDFHIELIH